jgi:hypothetical protein
MIIRTLGSGTGSEKKGNTDDRQLLIKGSSGKIVLDPHLVLPFAGTLSGAGNMYRALQMSLKRNLSYCRGA